MPLKIVARQGTASLWIVGTVRGRRVRESAGTVDRSLAEERRAAREAELYRAAVHGEKQASVTFAAAAESYLKASPRSAGTRWHLLRLVRHFGPRTLCDEIDQARIDKAAEALLQDGWAAATKLRNVVTPARAVLTHAARRRWCQPPAFEARAPSVARTEWLAPAEATRLLDASATHLRPLIVFLVCTGARLGEALRLDWRDVDLTHARAVLRETKGRPGEKRDRIVDLPPRAVAALEGQKHRTGAVFRRDDGEPYADHKGLYGGHIKRAWAGALGRSKIGKDVTPHSCRHTWASWHYAVHKDLLLLKADGQWQSVALVERYAKLVPAGLVPEIVKWLDAGQPQAATGT